jgi:hypothetical protein
LANRERILARIRAKNGYKPRESDSPPKKRAYYLANRDAILAKAKERYLRKTRGVKQ